MPDTPRLRPLRARSWFGPLAALFTLAGCLSDPASPRSTARVAINTSIHGAFQQVGGREVYLLVNISYFTSSESTELLKQSKFELGGSDEHAISVDILPCLQEQRGGFGSLAVQQRAAPMPSRDGRSIGRSAPPLLQTEGEVGCQAFIEVLITTGTTTGDSILDRQSTGAFLKIGETARVETPPLFAGVNPPTITGNSAVFVDTGLVRVDLTARDPDGNLSAIGVELSDIELQYFNNFYVDLSGAPVDSLIGPVYGFVTRGGSSSTEDVILQAYDTKGATSAADTSSIITFPNFNGPTASGVTAVRDGTSVTITFAVSDTSQDNDRVEVLFRDPNVSSFYANLLTPLCVRSITAASGTKTVSCPAPPVDVNVPTIQVIVVPIDAAGNVGNAARGTLP